MFNELQISNDLVFHSVPSLAYDLLDYMWKEKKMVTIIIHLQFVIVFSLSVNSTGGS